jgi:hypothetical protein
MPIVKKIIHELITIDPWLGDRDMAVVIGVALSGEEKAGALNGCDLLEVRDIPYPLHPVRVEA